MVFVSDALRIVVLAVKNGSPTFRLAFTIRLTIRKKIHR